MKLTPREIALLRKPITETSGGWQSALREAATRIYPDGSWRVTEPLMRRLFRMCTQQGPHGGYQGRLPMRVLGPLFAHHQRDWCGTWFYGKQEAGETHRIKLGKTDTPKRRNVKYSTDNPRRMETVFCIWDPSGTYEGRVKKRFATMRHHEWYVMTPEVQTLVRLCCGVQTTAELPEL